MTRSLRVTELSEFASSMGMELISAASCERANQALAVSAPRLLSWQESGYAGQMQYMKKGHETHCSLDSYLANVSSVLSFAVPFDAYLSGDPHSHSEQRLPPGFGRIARYARGRDYHRVVKKKLKRFAGLIQERLLGAGSFSYRAFVDAVPLLERSLSTIDKRGFIGKNTMHIIPRQGSYFFLCELLFSGFFPEGTLSWSKNTGRCGSCERCLRYCPTGALVSPRVLDARKCISYLTIEKKGVFEPWEQSAIGEWLFGCDECQTICPFNHQKSSAKSLEPKTDFSLDFSSQRASGGSLSLFELLSYHDDSQFLERFAGTALMRAGREGLLRNACHVAVNTQSTGVYSLLEQRAVRDSSAVIRESAVQALGRLSML